MVKFFKNRYNILYMVIVVMLVILGFRMAVLTIVEGEEYRQIADIKKIKDIPVKAPRGKIFDRNGILLADNVSSFTVQMYTDEIKPSDFNDIAYKLSKILDENIERPIDDFPIELDTFDYIDESLEIMDSSADNTEEIEVLTYRTAEETVIERVKENIHEWLNFSTLIYGENFSPKQRVHAALLDDEVPIELKGESFEYIEDMTVPIESEENERDEDAPEIKTPIQIWLSENNLKENLSAEKAVEHLLVNNNKYLSSLFSNSKIRRLSYEFLKKEGLASNIKLNEFSFIQDEEYENIKRNLNASNEEITLSTTAKDDFVILTMKNSIDSLLKTVYKGNEKVKPGEILINRLKEIYPDLPVKFMEDGETGIFEYTDTEIRNKYFAQQHMDYSTSAYDFVKELAFKNFDVLYNLITDDDIKQYSQIELLKHVNPSISITDWEYTPIRNKINWIKNNVETAQDDGVYSAEEVFKMLRESLEISEDINDYDMRNMMVIRERYNRISYYSYHPVDICYGISEKTVAMIAERSHELNGINIEIEPLRYYPQHESASHIIGYLGKIAHDYEIQEYVVEKGYSTEDIIGKTGLEEKFEDYLRGKKGKKTVEVNNVGRTIRSVSSEAPVPGDDLYLTIEEILSNNETKINITLCQGIPKQTKMDTIIQQNVEMGVKRFIPLITERTVVKLNEKEREQKKLDRWQKIAKESAKQSKRNIIPSVEPIMTLEELIEKLRREEDAAVIVPYELEDVKQLKDILCEQRDNYYIVIGPEGGFDIKEIEMFQEIGAHIVTLGKRILRTETAGVVTAAIVLYACNELN
jgi:penicillin-binding protein 2